MVDRQVARDRTRDYISFMECDAGDNWLSEVEAQLSAWLRRKGLDVDLTANSELQSGTTKLTVRRHENDGVRDLYFSLSEDGGKLGVWSTELFAHDENGSKDWISLTVGNSLGKFVKTPALARYLMDVLPLRDSRLDLTGRPQLWKLEDVDQLLELLQDESRHGLAFIAGSDNSSQIDLNAYVKKVEVWSKEVFGLAQVVVLDPAATAEFAARVGLAQSVPPWTLRTYHPGVRFSDPIDGRRHRILGTTRLATKSDHAIQYLLGEVARQQAASRPQDVSLLKVIRRFARIENRRLVEEVRAIPAPASTDVETVSAPPQVGVVEGAADLHELAEQVGLVKRMLGLKRVTEQALREVLARITGADEGGRSLAALKRRVDTLQLEKEAVEDENRLLHESLNDAQLETDYTSLQLDDRDSKIRWLEARLRERGDYEASYIAVPEEFRSDAPGDFKELLDRIARIEGIQFTGVDEDVERLDLIDSNGAALRTAWDAVQVLGDYVRARREGTFDKGLDHFIKYTPEGYRTISSGKFAETETGVTMRSFGAERIFPVPDFVHSSGRVAMKAHFKLARIGLTSPRMYIYDVNPATPLVCIGYIGAHLTNTQTN